MSLPAFAAAMAWKRVPVVGRDDEHAVDVAAGEELAEVAEDGDPGRLVEAQLFAVDALGQPLGVLGPVGVDVADGDDAGADLGGRGR